MNAFKYITIHIKTIWEHVSIILAPLSKRLMRYQKLHIWVTNQEGPLHPSAYVGTSVMADRTRLRIIAVMHYALCVWMPRALLMIRKITVGRQVYAPFTVCFSLHERVRLWKRVRESSCLRESESTRARKRSDRLDWVVAGGSYFYRHAALCSAERIAECIIARLYASMRPEIRFLLSQTRWKLIGSSEDCTLR